nr:response regulator 12 [Tanacetum cinerariifolium]
VNNARCVTSIKATAATQVPPTVASAAIDAYTQPFTLCLKVAIYWTNRRNRGTGRSSTELKMGQRGQGEGCLLDQKKLLGGYVASNGYGSLDDLMNAMMKRV